MKKPLEKIVNSVKEVGRTIKEHGFKIATAVALPFIFGYNNANASNLRVYNASHDVFGDSMEIKNIEGGTEGYDGYDLPYIDSPDELHIYSNNLNCGPSKLGIDARGPNSTTTFNLELYNKGFSGFADNYLKLLMINDDNFLWKNMFLGDIDDSNDIIHDIKYIIENGGISPSGFKYGYVNLPDVQGSKTGVYDKRKILIYNHADLNRDRKVNFVDWAIFANAYKEGRTDIEKGSNPNALEDYADIENFYDANGVMVSYGNGTVDTNDMSIFLGEWLWIADDPNTW